jgi:hypothetical protein
VLGFQGRQTATISSSAYYPPARNFKVMLRTTENLEIRLIKINRTLGKKPVPLADTHNLSLAAKTCRNK